MYQDEENGPIGLRSVRPLAFNKLSDCSMRCPPPHPAQVLWPVRTDSKEDQAWLNGAVAGDAKERAEELDSSSPGSAATGAEVKKERGLDEGEGKDFTHFLEERAPDMPKAEERVWAKASAAYVATKTCLSQLLRMDLESDRWSKDATKFLKSNTMKLNRARIDLIKAPFKRYLDEIDVMTKANQSGLAFVREAQARV